MDQFISPSLLSNLDVDKPVPPEMQIGWEKLLDLNSDAVLKQLSAEADVDVLLILVSQLLEQRESVTDAVLTQLSAEADIDDLLIQAFQQIEQRMLESVDGEDAVDQLLVQASQGFKSAACSSGSGGSARHYY